jgi:hypothetical protein
MRSDVHSSALRAAAQVAFSVAFTYGCTAPVSPSDVKEGDGTAADSSESDIKSGCGSTKDAGAATPDSSAPTLSCDDVVNAAFPTEGNYPGKKESVSVEVQTCCEKLITSTEGVLEHHRWDCCANLPADAGASVGSACTPWGPPVPPAMISRNRRARLEVA